MEINQYKEEFEEITNGMGIAIRPITMQIWPGNYRKDHARANDDYPSYGFLVRQILL